MPDCYFLIDGRPVPLIDTAVYSQEARAVIRPAPAASDEQAACPLWGTGVPFVKRKIQLTPLIVRPKPHRC